MPTVEERVAQLEQDVQTLREVGVVAGQHAYAFGIELVRRDIAELRSEAQGGIADLGARLDVLEQRMVGVEQQVTGMRGWLATIDGKLDELLRRPA